MGKIQKYRTESLSYLYNNVPNDALDSYPPAADGKVWSIPKIVFAEFGPLRVNNKKHRISANNNF